MSGAVPVELPFDVAEDRGVKALQDDPVDMPAVLARLERDLSLCVDRDGAEICQRLVLD